MIRICVRRPLRKLARARQVWLWGIGGAVGVVLFAAIFGSPAAVTSQELGDATPTPTPALPVHTLWGDADCDGRVRSVDALAVLVYVAALPPLPQDDPCHAVGSLHPRFSGIQYGDVFCDGRVDAVDALGILLKVAGLGARPKPPLCPPIGASVGD